MQLKGINHWVWASTRETGSRNVFRHKGLQDRIPFKQSRELWIVDLYTQAVPKPKDQKRSQHVEFHNWMKLKDKHDADHFVGCFVSSEITSVLYFRSAKHDLIDNGGSLGVKSIQLLTYLGVLRYSIEHILVFIAYTVMYTY